MPELPEVQSVANYIKPFLLNQTISKIEPLNNFNRVFETHSSDEIIQLVKGQHINNVFRRGKYIIIDLDQGFLCIHLRMTGQLQTQLTNQDNKKHFTAKIDMQNGKELYFKDYRKFGRFYYYESLDILENKLGCEPLSPSFDLLYLLNGLKKSRGMIKPKLLDQSFIAGLGNIYVDESLWEARIHPRKISMNIGNQKIKKLWRAIPSILKSAINYNGTTIINFSYGNKIPGGFKKYLNVFGKEGSPCPRCNNNLKKIFVGQRGTHYCSKCQKL